LKRTTALSAFSITVATVAIAAADPSTRIAIVVHSSGGGVGGEFEAILRSELLSEGFEVLTTARSESDPRTLATVAEQTDSAAAVAVVEPPGALAADVWIRNPAKGNVSLRQVRREVLGPEAPSIVAIRTAEVLRASFLESGAQPHPERSVKPDAQAPALHAGEPSAIARTTSAGEAERPEPPNELGRPRWSVGAGLGVTGGPGGVAPMPVPAVTISWRASSAWTGEVLLVGPALGTTTTSVGSAKIDQEFAVPRLLWEAPGTSTGLRPFVAGGVGFYHLGARGSTTAPYMASSGHAWSGIAVGGVGARMPVSRWLRVGSELSGFIAAPRPVLRFAGQDPIYTGRPGVLAMVEAEVAW
jgi:hypothetical protein